MQHEENKNIRNFCIIAHIDHGKSTLADRMLELTNTVEARKMREQFLDQHPLERERGITIKMRPVRMIYHPHWTIDNLQLTTDPKSQESNVKGQELSNSKQEFVLNLIDTPGHIDFNYEVSRALAAVDGAVLLVDATQGVEAQTISNVEFARELNLAIIPVINKIDLPQARIVETKEEIKKLLNCENKEILAVSARTGEGVRTLLDEIVRRVPSPKFSEVVPPIFGGTTSESKSTRVLIFDFEYSQHRGAIGHVRVFGGEVKKGSRLKLFASKTKFIAIEVGIFKPELAASDSLAEGEIGYIVTGIKEAKIVRAGDTILEENSNSHALPGYREPRPVVFSSLYPESQDYFEDLRKALERLKLVDSALFFEEESSGVLGRGFRCGFLGMLHLEIVAERLKRDFEIGVIAATPTVKYKVATKRGEVEVYSPAKFPEEHEIIEILEPYLKIEIFSPPERLPHVLKLLQEHEAKIGDTEKFSAERVKLIAEMPLRELVRDFFDSLKSVSQGYASLNYEFLDMRPADLLRLEILVAEEVVPAFSKIVSRARVEHEAEEAVEKLYNILPKALFPLKIQARAAGRILASRTLKAMSKDVTGYLYGGDRTRKMKLWKKQKEGKKRLGARADYQIPPDVYLKVIRK